MISNTVFVRGALIAALLLAGSNAFAQTRAVESTNFEFDLESTDRDTSGSTSNGTLGGNITGTMPIGSWFAASLSGGYSTSRGRTRDVLRNEDGSLSGIRPSCNFDTLDGELSLFARRPTWGKIGVSYGFGDVSADCGVDSIFLPTGDDTLDSERYRVDMEVYLGDFTLGASHSTTSLDSGPDLETLAGAASWYPIDSLKITLHGNDLYDEDTYGIVLEHQPEFLGDGFGVRVGYAETDGTPGVRTINIGLSYYFGTKVPLKARDRQYR